MTSSPNEAATADLDAFFDEVEEAEHQADESTEQQPKLQGESSAKWKDDAPTTSKVGPLPEKDDTAKPTAKRPRLEQEDSKQQKQQPKVRSAVVVAASAPSVVVAAASPAILSTDARLLPSVGPMAPPYYDAAKPPLPPPLPSTGPIPTPPPPPPPPPAQPQGGKLSVTKRSAAGKTWVDESLAEFPPDDFRLFVGNLARDIRLEQLSEAFSSKYPSFTMARIVYDKASGKSRGYGFVSLKDPKEFARAIREMDQVFLGSRPIRVKRSDWKDWDAGSKKTKGGQQQQRHNNQRRGDASFKRKR